MHKSFSNSANSTPELTTGSITRHLVRLSVPAAMGMLFNTLYNLTDLWFAGLLSTDALAAVSIAGSVFFLLLSIGFGMQAGVAVVVSNALGRREKDNAISLCDNALGLALVLSFFVLLAGLLFGGPLVRVLGATGQVSAIAISYLKIIFWGAPVFITSFAVAGALVGFGNTTANRNVLIIGFFCNLLLNPLLIFVFDWGVSGLAFATVIIKFVSVFYLLWVLSHYTAKNVTPRFFLSRQLELIHQVMPASATMISIVIGGFITVFFIGRFGSNHVAGYMVGLRLEQILLLPALGLNSAVIAIVGQNFGADIPERVQETYASSLKLGALIAVAAVPIMIFFSPVLMGYFSQNEEVIKTGTLYLRIDALVFFAYVILFQSTACLQAIKQPLFPMGLGLVRHLLAPMTLYYVLISIYCFSYTAVFWSLFGIVLVSAVASHIYVCSRLKILVSN